MQHDTLLFVSGSAIHPTEIRQAWPGASFIARARIAAEPGELNPFFTDALPRTNERVDVWGLALRVPQPVAGEPRRGWSDEGDDLTVIVAGGPLLSGDPEAVLAMAQYWELPPAFTTLLREAAGVDAPAAEGGWESPLLEAEPPTPAT